ncbi:unnamed protein product [Phytophthora fragariaefolia]|uniref:Unnamed protein product n=1 Tax=Phytophthora fragariaefolia TaxID=1490495 RepID=A0A9W6UBT3_9STRA|nr:unnamed protein product [Phytophthora fragariaefolia]
MRSASRLAGSLFVLSAAVQLELQSVTAHSWIDCFDTNYTKIYDQSASYIYGGSGGNGFCDGYGAGYPGRGDTDIGTEYTFKMLENEVEEGTTVCETVDADTYTSTDWRKRISVAPGTTVYFAYLPNGHIVKDKKAIGTQHGIYWTGQVGTTLTSTLEMTQENLMDGHTLDFDDGNCGESMVWYWTFWLDNEASYVDQSQARGYFGAAYSTCFEVEVTSRSGGSTVTAVPSTSTPESAIPAPQTTTDSPSVHTPESTTSMPQLTSAPRSTNASPVATTATPVATIETPVATTDEPLSTTAAPAATTAAPLSSWDQVDANGAAGDADPTAMTNAPVATTSAPQVATATPVTNPPTAVPTPSPTPSMTPASTPTPVPTPTTFAPIVAVAYTPVTEPTAETISPPDTSAPTSTGEPDARTGSDDSVDQTTVLPASTPSPPTEEPKITASSSESEDGYSTFGTFSALDDNHDSVGIVHPASPSLTHSASCSSSNEGPSLTSFSRSHSGSSSNENLSFTSFNSSDSASSSNGNSSLTNFSSSDSSSSSIDSLSSSGSAETEVGSESFKVDPEVSYDSLSTSKTSEENFSASTSSSTASASANAETSSSNTYNITPSFFSLTVFYHQEQS